MIIVETRLVQLMNDVLAIEESVLTQLDEERPILTLLQRLFLIHDRQVAHDEWIVGE